MKKIKIILTIILLFGISVFIFRDFIFSINTPEIVIDEDIKIKKTEVNKDVELKENNTEELPIDRVNERILKKSFGDFITLQDSPVQPERFSGYHTGIDLEIFEGEASEDILVKSICDGEIASKRTASGYGGLVVQKCEFDGEEVAVIYGHLDIKSIESEAGDRVEAGEVLGELGEGNSTETDGERKHLHLGIYRGENINIKGYVQSKEELNNWIDPCDYICNK